MLHTLEENLSGYFKKAPALTRGKLVHAIIKDYPELAESTIKVYLSKFKKQGLLYNPSRGLYSIQQKAEFAPSIDAKIKTLYKKLHVSLPYATLCVWDTKWLNDYMRHQPVRHYIVVEAERDVMEAVHSFISPLHVSYLDPDTSTFDLYIAYSDHPVILRPLISEAPLEKIKNVSVPALEKLLVDMLADTDLFAAQQGELPEIFKSAFERHNLSTAKMNRYAMRRNRKTEVERLLNAVIPI